MGYVVTREGLVWLIGPWYVSMLSAPSSSAQQSLPLKYI